MINNIPISMSIQAVASDQNSQDYTHVFVVVSVV